MNAAGYRKLPGRGSGWTGVSRLWLGAEHLLEVNSTLFTERYHRFFLTDIRAILIRETRVRLGWTIALGLLLLAFAGIASGFAYASTQVDGQEPKVVLLVFAGIFGGFGAVFLIALLINLALGPTVSCLVQTAAGLHPLAAPNRLRNARRALDQLIPIIAEAQAAVRVSPLT